MKTATTSGTIVHTDRFGIDYRICRLDYTERDDDTFEYVFTPDYRIISLLPEGEFQGIPGLDLDLHLERYVRSNIDPVYITERTPGPNREDLVDMLDSVGMEYLDRLEWSIRTKLRYHGDRLHTIRYEEVTGTIDLSSMSTSSANYCRDVLTAIGKGQTAVCNGTATDTESLKAVCVVLRAALASENRDRKQRGRKTAHTSNEQIAEAADRMGKGCSADEIAAELGISRATLYRRIRALNRGRRDQKMYP